MNLLELFVKVGVKDETAGQLSSIASNATSALGKAGNAVSKLGSVGTAAVKKMGVAVAGVGGTVAGLAVTGGISRALKIEEAEAKLKGLGNTTEEVSAIMDNAKAAVTGTSYGLGDAATAAGVLAAAGIEAGDGLQDMQGVLQTIASVATVSGREFSDVSSIFGKVAANGKLTTESMLQLQDSGIPVLSMLAEHFGVAADEMQELVTEGEVDFATFNEVMSENMGEAAEIAGTTFTASMKNAKAALSKIGEAGATPVLAALRDVMLELNPVINALVPYAQEAGAAISEWLEGPVQAATGFLGAMHDEIEGGASVWDAFKAALESVGLGEFAEKVQSVADYVGERFDAIRAFAEDMAGEVGDAFDGIDFSAFGGVIDSLVEFAEDVSPLVADAAGLLCDAVALVIEDFDDVVVTVGMAAGAFAAFKAAMAITETITAVKTALEAFKVAQEATTISQAALNAVMNANPFVLIASLIAMLVAGLVTLWVTNDDFRTAVEGAWNGLCETAANVWGSICDFFTVTVPNALTEMLEWFGSLPEQIGGFFGGILEDVGNWASDMKDNAVQAATDFKDNLIEGIQSIPEKMLTLGGDIIEGLKNGIVNAGSSVVNAITGIAGDALNAAKSFLGIASPSKVFRKIGEFTMQGMALGISDGEDGVVSAMEAAAGAVEVAATVSAGFSGGSGSGGVSIGEIHVHVDSMASIEQWRGFVSMLKTAKAMA